MSTKSNNIKYVVLLLLLTFIVIPSFVSSGPNIQDNSASIFDIFSMRKSGLKVLSPNGDESFVTQQMINISWSTIDKKINTVDIILLSKDNVLVKIISTSTPNTGNFSWLIPSTLVNPGTTSAYKIYIVGRNGKSGDMSDTTFSVTGSPTYGLTIVSPNGGEIWSNATQTITWNATGIGATPGEYVKLALLDENGFPFDYLINKSGPGETCVVNTEVGTCVPISAGKFNAELIPGWILPGRYKIQISCFRFGTPNYCGPYAGSVGDVTDGYITVPDTNSI